MNKASIKSNYLKKYLLHLELLPVLAFTTLFDINQITSARQVSAAVVNISGRQRMLSQRSALLAVRLVSSQKKAERESLRQSLQTVIDLMQNSHNALIRGDRSLNLSAQLSPAIKAMYFEPLNLDRQIRNYIAQVKALLQTDDPHLTQDNPHLQYILAAASTDLLAALDAVVSQYEQESDLEQLAIDIKQAQLYQESCTATAIATAQAAELEKTLQELKQTQAQLIHNEKMSGLGQLLAGVAHEINNPVSFIHGNLKYASDYIQDLLELLQLYQQHPNNSPLIKEKIAAIDLDFLLEDLPKVLSSMQVGTERICDLVLNLRNFSRTDQSLIKLVNIHEGIDSTLMILQNRLKATSDRPSINVVKKYGDLPYVECYPGQMNQVFMNILSNAIDAIEESLPNRTGEIQICTQVMVEAIAILIADNGAGMTEQVKTQLFERFFTTKELGKGTGLGLSISYQIVVEKHGGTIKCTSAPGEGTQFWIEVPVSQTRQPVTLHQPSSHR